MNTRSGSEPYLVDSSGWLEYLTEDSKAASFGNYLEGDATVLVPTVVIFEVYKHLSKHRGKSIADRFASQALVRKVVPLDETIALAAANVSLEHRLSGADAVVYATARVCPSTARHRQHSLPRPSRRDHPVSEVWQSQMPNFGWESNSTLF